MRRWIASAVGLARALVGATTLAVGLVILAGCDRGGPGTVAPAATSTAFSHAIEDDVSGSYRPVSAVTAGDWRLTQLFLGQAADFRAWEGGSRGGGRGPVMVEFANAAGGTVQVLPQAYAVGDGRVRFAGRHPDVGEVTFEGALDAGALATARRNLGEDAPVLSGTLRVGDRNLGTQAFRWYGGD